MKRSLIITFSLLLLGKMSLYSQAGTEKDKLQWIRSQISALKRANPKDPVRLAYFQNKEDSLLRSASLYQEGAADISRREYKRQKNAVLISQVSPVISGEDIPARKELEKIERELRWEKYHGGPKSSIAFLKHRQDSLIEVCLNSRPIKKEMSLREAQGYRNSLMIEEIKRSPANGKGFLGLLINRRPKESVNFMIKAIDFDGRELSDVASFYLMGVNEYNSTHKGEMVKEVVLEKALLPSIRGRYRCYFFVAGQNKGYWDFSVPSPQCEYKGKECAWYLSFGRENQIY